MMWIFFRNHIFMQVVMISEVGIVILVSGIVLWNYYRICQYNYFTEGACKLCGGFH